MSDESSGDIVASPLLKDGLVYPWLKEGLQHLSSVYLENSTSSGYGSYPGASRSVHPVRNLAKKILLFEHNL